MRPTQGILVLTLLLSATADAQFGTGTQVYPFGGSAKMRAADIDGDGDQDLLGVFNDQHLKWFENTDGAGGFGPALSIETINGGCSSFGLADVDGDGDPDVTLLSNEAEGVEMLRNAGSGSFADLELVAPTTSMATALATADLNGDGRLDLITTQSFAEGPGLAWYAGTLNGFAAPVELPGLHNGMPSTLLLVGDIDLVGGLDVVLKGENDQLVLARNSFGDASVWEVTEFPIPAGAPDYPYRTPQLIDVDGDGDLDLAESRGPAVHWLCNDLDEGGDLSFVEKVVEPWTISGNGVFGPSPCGTGAAVVFVPNNPILPVRWNAYVPLLADFPYSNDLPALPRGTDPLLADLNGDGKDDLVMALPNGISWFPSTLIPSTEELLLPLLDTLCVNAPPTELPAAIPTGGEWYGTQVADNVLYRGNLGTTMDLPLVHVVYATDGCPMSASSSVRLIEGPIITSLVPSVICSADEPIQMTSIPTNTEWFGLDGSSILDPSLFDGGYVVCQYNDVTGSMCSDVNGPIARWTTLAAEIEPAGPFCAEDAMQTITAAAAPPFGVSWSGDISSSTSSSATFDPAQGPGQYVVVLSVQPVVPNQCPNSDTLHITVGERPTITFTEFPVYCAEGVGIPLGGATPADGVWGGYGVADGLLEPNVVGPGMHLLTYFATTPEGCGAQGTTSIELISATTIMKPDGDLFFCAADGPVQFGALPSGGTWGAPLGEDGSFSPSEFDPGTYPVRYTFADPRGCLVQNDAETFTIGATSEVSIEPVGTLCTTAAPVDLIGSISGTWSGAVMGEGQVVHFDPSATGPGIWEVTLTASLPDECPGSTTQQIIVDICAGMNKRSLPEMSLLPNPFVERTSIISSGDGPMLVEVVDISGRVIRSTKHMTSVGQLVPIDLSDRPAGTYLVRTQLQGRSFNLRAVKSE